MSVREWLERHTRRPRLRRMVAAGARTFVYSAALDVVSAEVFVDKMQCSNKHPIHYVEGGWQYLVDALRQKARFARSSGSALMPGFGQHLRSGRHEGI